MAYAWLAFVVFGLIVGWHLKPRPDEVLFVLTLPLWLVLLPYGVFCLGAAVLKVLWPIWLQRRALLLGRGKVRVDLRRNRLRDRP